MMKYLLFVLFQVSSMALAQDAPNPINPTPCIENINAKPMVIGAVYLECAGPKVTIPPTRFGNRYYRMASVESVSDVAQGLADLNQKVQNLNDQLMKFSKSEALPGVAQKVGETLRIDQDATNQHISKLEAKNKSLEQRLENIEKKPWYKFGF